MAAVFSPTPSAAANIAAADIAATDIAAADIAAVPSIPENHPSYEDMILSAIEALKGRKGSSWYAISKYISDNFSDLPPTHATLLTHHLRLLHSKGVIRMLKLCYKLHDGSTKRGRGRPPKSPSSVQPKRRGRPPKLLSDVVAANKAAAPVADGPVYIISQAEQLSSGLLQSFPGAVAIVVPRSLLTEKAARSPIVILPKGIQSLIDASVGGRKMGRPKKNAGGKRKRGRPRKEEVMPKQELGVYGHEKGPGRPWKIRDLLVPGNAQEILEKPREPGMLDSVGGIQEVKKRSVGRPRKKPLIEGPDSLSDVLVK